MAVNGMARNGKIALLRSLLKRFRFAFSQVTIPFEAIYKASKNGDRIAVILILRSVVNKYGRASGWANKLNFDDYIYHALKGSVHGEQFRIFKRLIHLYDRNGQLRVFPYLIVRDLLNQNLRSWLDHSISKCNYMFDRKKVIESYVKRSNLKDGNPVKPSPDNLYYLMQLPDDNHIPIKSLISIMFVADYDIQEHLARLLLDPALIFEVQEYIMIGRKRRKVQKLVSGFEALNYAIDMVNLYKSHRYKHVQAALEKVKVEFEPMPIRDLETNLETDTELLDFLRNAFVPV
jgi:hypothetical protein